MMKRLTRIYNLPKIDCKDQGILDLNYIFTDEEINQISHIHKHDGDIEIPLWAAYILRLDECYNIKTRTLNIKVLNMPFIDWIKGKKFKPLLNDVSMNIAC